MNNQSLSKLMQEKAGELAEIVDNNGSNEIGEDGGLAWQSYSEDTIHAIALSAAYLNIASGIIANVQDLIDGEVTELQFHHNISETLDNLENGIEVTYGND